MSEIVAVYDYRDVTGELLYQKVRFEPKRFALRRPLPTEVLQALNLPGQNRSGWAWGLGGGTYGAKSRVDEFHFREGEDPGDQVRITLDRVPKVLYRLPEVGRANPEVPVFLVEGEKDADTLTGLGFVATCGPNGSSAWDQAWCAALEGRRVVLIPDNDLPGMHHAATVGGGLLLAGVRSVRVIRPGEAGYDVGPGGDVTDWLTAATPEVDKWKGLVVGLCKKFPEHKAW